MTMTDRMNEMTAASKWDFSDLKALFINCTLKRSPEKSNLLHHARMLKDAGGMPAR